MAERRYKAFISYSHRDKRVANWLHHALETYRLPDQARVTMGRQGLQPIFKDRDELPAADSLGEAIEQAIRASDALIVLCSPSAAKSPWIAREIDLYKRLNGDRGIFPVIVEGEPPDNFPAPLLVHYENGEPTDAQSEPIAADIRPEGDGKKLAKLKLIAGLAHLDLDSLVQRDAARRQKRLAMVAAASLVGMVGTSGLALYAIDQRNEAREQRAEADGLIEYMLTDLRKQLEPVGRLEVLDGVGKRAMDYYARQKLEDLSDSELGRRARATMLVAEVQNVRGDNAGALPAFQQAARTTEALLLRKPDDPERMYNHGQSLFWVGYIAWQHGRMDEAREALEGYSEISHELAALDRENLEWQMEEAYSLSNLGTMDFEGGNLASALDYFQRSLDRVDAVSEKEGRPVARQIELGESHSWVSTTLRDLGRIEDAIGVRERELGIYAPLRRNDPGNVDAIYGEAYAAAAMGNMLMEKGDFSRARTMLEKSIALGEEQIAADPQNTFAKELIRASMRDRALLAWLDGDRDTATRLFERLETHLASLQAADRDNYEWNVEDPVRLALYRAFSDRLSEPADSLRARALSWRKALKREDPDSPALLVGSYVAEGLALDRLNRNSEARTAYRKAVSIGDVTPEVVNTRKIALQAVAAERLGDRQGALSLRRRLTELGVDPPIDNALRR
ncbi:toll/interleukin-1 receptor domain-containing protein [Qipengyuania seohaensis]|uniref:toll/interleukin-1 receptor domain-containing protein n=1 Tax=Qipengyuania seohaensis TaxID=266951 RepID=UPI0018E1EFB0|nr:toll/interleukin-1 receptor domain-containing protein [Qipengyuania seohaensis]